MYIKADRKPLDGVQAVKEIVSDGEHKEIDGVSDGTEREAQRKDRPRFINIGSRSPLDSKLNDAGHSFDARRLGSDKPNSLKFLYKPQRVKTMNMDKFPEEELKRNTNLNKRLSMQGQNLADALKRGSDVSLPPDITNTPVSPKSSVPQPRIDTSNMRLVNSKMALSDEYELSDASIVPQVYKKSGELLKSSLKRRSKSLPTTPDAGLSALDDQQVDPLSRGLLRSKSVHFDQKTPVKYFSEDESPKDVRARAAIENSLNFLPKPVNLINGMSALEDLETRINPAMLQMHIESAHAGDHASTNKKTNAKLRKSKRFQQMNPQNANNEENQSDASDELKSVSKSKSKNVVLTNYRVVGLYNRNFPILSNKNPKSLKLNIFLNIARGRKVFLQELSLHVQRQFNHGPKTNNYELQTNTRILSGLILVKNIYYEKEVTIRYTWDRWRTTKEIQCLYRSSADGIVPGKAMDIFSFLIDDCPRSTEISKAILELCVHYTTRNGNAWQEYWDNNSGNNYRVDVVFNGFTNPFSYNAMD